MKYLGKCVDRQGAIADLYTTGLKYYRTNPGHKREDKKRFKALWKNGKYIGKVNTWLVNYMVRKRWPVPMKAIPKGEEMRSWLASMAYSHVVRDRWNQLQLCTEENKKFVHVKKV